mmetsp:Transcript_14398/g.36187  ORF Transcript_14398/g.36187 Transcript_14398/m.36187 type:complete len:103 (-) Transcript_14398:135-443(-)
MEDNACTFVTDGQKEHRRIGGCPSEERSVGLTVLCMALSSIRRDSITCLVPRSVVVLEALTFLRLIALFLTGMYPAYSVARYGGIRCPHNYPISGSMSDECL